MQQIAYVDVTNWPIKVTEVIRKLSLDFGFEYNAYWIEDQLTIEISKR